MMMMMIQLLEPIVAPPAPNCCDLGFKFSFGRSASLLSPPPYSTSVDVPRTLNLPSSVASAAVSSENTSSSFRLSSDLPHKSFSLYWITDHRNTCQNFNHCSIQMMPVLPLEGVHGSNSTLWSNRLQPYLTNAKAGQCSQDLYSWHF